MNFLPARPSAAVRRDNRRALELMSFYMNVLSDAISLETLDETAREFGVDRARAYAECVAALGGIGSDKREREFFETYLVPMFSELDAGVFRRDPYYKSIKIRPRSLGRWELGTGRLAAAELFACGDLRVSPEGRVLPRIGFFAENFDYPAVFEGGREWMTLMPNETLTTASALREASGRVLSYGLGLGYFAFMAAEKPEVESVTVVELSREAIELFQSELLPQFPHREKLRLINDNALDYAARAEGYDFVFADIWHDAADGCAPYRALKALERPGTRYAYWLEGTLLCYLNGYFDD